MSTLIATDDGARVNITFLSVKETSVITEKYIVFILHKH